MKTPLLIEQHFHGAFGICFNTASVEDVLYLSKEILKYGVGGIFPTIVTDSVENTRHAVNVIKTAAELQTSDMARILGIHLEGIFLNPEKKGIHNPAYFMKPAVENYKLIEDDFIKIVTLAPELCTPDKSLIEYLTSKGIKVQAGHCVGGDLTGCTGATHLFNAMSGISHRGQSTALTALVNDDIYTEIIADGVHISDDALRLVFKTKPNDKIILISDSLPITHSDKKDMVFAKEKIYYDGVKATSADGTIAGSTMLLPEIIKRLFKSGVITNAQSDDIFSIITKLIENPYKYHSIELDGCIEWDEDLNIINITSGRLRNPRDSRL